jgi:hypothetical protein
VSLGNLGNGPKTNKENTRDREEMAAANPALEDHEQRAAKRMLEFKQLHGDVDSFSDDYVDPWLAQAPPHWTYNWKTYSVWNREYPSYIAQCQRNFWQPVPASRHKDMLYPGYEGENIIKDGLMLMERPTQLTRAFQVRDEKRARDQVFNSESKLREAPPGTAPRDQHPRTLPRVAGHVGPVDIPA